MHTECLTPQSLAVLKSLTAVVQTHEFVLAGGTAAALQLGHRKSADFDFFTMRRFSTDKILQELRTLDLKPAILQEDKDTLTITSDQVKVSFFHYPYPFIERTVDLNGVPIAGLVDIAAMKVFEIAQRGAKRDFVDLYFIVQEAPFAKIAANMLERFGPDRINPVAIGKALVYFSDAEADPEPEYLGKKKEWKSIKKYFADHVQQFVLDLHRAISDRK